MRLRLTKHDKAILFRTIMDHLSAESSMSSYIESSDEQDQKRLGRKLAQSLGITADLSRTERELLGI